MHELSGVTPAQQRTALAMSTISFTTCFAIWTIFAIIGVKIKEDLGLNGTQFGLLIGTPILTGSLIRTILGIWSDQYGGRKVFVAVMLSAAASTYLLSFATTYDMMLLAALGVGIAGGGFSVGITYVSRWYPKEKQGLALGIFGAGNVGAAVTKILAPFVMVAFGWHMVAQVWAAALAGMAILFLLLTKEDPVTRARQSRAEKPRSIMAQLRPLKYQQVWRFALYYFFVFGGFVALALWLPHYLVDVYHVDIKTAGMLAGIFSLTASLFRVHGGYLSDKYGARTVMYWTLGVCAVCLFMLSYPETDYVIHGIRGEIHFTTRMDLIPFVIVLFVLGFFMSLGKAAVYKHIPVYYPNDVGAVGGMVGMIGGLGGFVLPIVFGVMNDLAGIWTSCYFLLFIIAAVSLLWMHFSIRAMERRAAGAIIETLPEMPEFEGMQPAVARSTLADWRPEDPEFWETTGARIANRNLLISIPALLLAFAVWMVWSVVVVKLPAVGFKYTADQLFWLAALPGLSGATLRMFYSFMIPVAGGRLWTTLSTASLLIPAFGIGYAVQDTSTPYFIFLVLALLCGFGGGNFASSMANISFFFPKSQKGNALALNAGLGNLGVSVVQFAVPLVITMSVFGAVGGEPQKISEGGQIWLQNAGFIWVPFIIASSVAAWLGMNDIASARASFAEQAVIFERKHNWIMCWLYTGTFGSFIGYSAGFPLLMKTEFPDVVALKYAFLGPLVGALGRATTGWLADKYGGGRVTLWTFTLMIAAAGGALYFLEIKDQPGAFWGFLTTFVLLFFLTGVGNASTFQMIPNIMRQEINRLMPGEPAEVRMRQSERESAAIIGFSSAIAAYGAFFIPKGFGSSIALTGSPAAAFWCFLAFYVTCVLITWFVYTRHGGLLHDIERGRTPTAAEPSPAPAV